MLQRSILIDFLVGQKCTVFTNIACPRCKYPRVRPRGGALRGNCHLPVIASAADSLCYKIAMKSELSPSISCSCVTCSDVNASFSKPSEGGGGGVVLAVNQVLRFAQGHSNSYC